MTKKQQKNNKKTAKKQQKNSKKTAKKQQKTNKKNTEIFGNFRKFPEISVFPQRGIPYPPPLYPHFVPHNISPFLRIFHL